MRAGPSLQCATRSLLHEEIALTLMYSVQGGNDYEIFESPETIGHTVNGPADTIAQTTKLFL